jgi:hypothetical protein
LEEVRNINRRDQESAEFSRVIMRLKRTMAGVLDYLGIALVLASLAHVSLLILILI